MARLMFSTRQTKSFLCVAAASKRFASCSSILQSHPAFIGTDRSTSTAFISSLSNTATKKSVKLSHSPTIARTQYVCRYHSLFASPLNENGDLPYQNQTSTNVRTITNDSSSTESKKNGPRTFKKKGQKGLFRADRVLAERSSLSRSQAFTIIRSRRLTIQKIPPKLDPTNDDDDTKSLSLTLIKGPKEKIAMNADLYLDGNQIPLQPTTLIAYHKPINVLSAMDEKHSTKKHLGLFLPKKYKKMHPVGRLDYDTSGLILFSRDGELTQRLLHPKYSVERQYVATVTGEVDNERLRVQLEETGVETGEGTHFGKLLDVHHLDSEESLAVLKYGEKNSAERSGSEETAEDGNEVSRVSLDNDVAFSNVRVAVQEGKHRMVRRMLANCKHPVVELKRERYGEVILGDLGVGEFRECTESEINWALQLLNNNKKKV